MITKEKITAGLSPRRDTIVRHGGKCPPGHIFDHNKKSPTYGKCIPIVKYREMHGRLPWQEDFVKIMRRG